MNSNLAVLIDGDNIPSAHVKEMRKLQNMAILQSKEFTGIGLVHIYRSGKTYFCKMQLLQFNSMLIPKEKMQPILQ